MFLSGVVKLASGDESWRDLSALSFHYWTQPLPTPLAPFMHALPGWVQRVSTLMTFAVELILPFFIFWPRVRAWTALGFAALSLLILLTGNYTFFNWLTLALVLWLIPDGVWAPLRERLPWSLDLVTAPMFPHPLTGTLMGVLCLVSALWCLRALFPDVVTDVFRPVLRYAQAFHISNSYGLFANMTKSRPEIVIEGSLDGQTWKEYEFKYKPGRLYRPPPIVAPHQPRLDWQMWFAALGPAEYSPWFVNLLRRLFENSPEVLGLLDGNPFADRPPQFLRAKLYLYEFTTPQEILESGQWWKRTLLGAYTPTLTTP
jgi:hypothetical protein